LARDVTRATHGLSTTLQTAEYPKKPSTRGTPVLIDATRLERLVADIFARAGCSAAEAERIGRDELALRFTVSAGSHFGSHPLC